MSGYDDSQVMLSDDLDRKMVFKYRDVRVPFYRLYKAGLYLCSRIVLMVQDTELRMGRLRGADRIRRSRSCRNARPSRSVV